MYISRVDDTYRNKAAGAKTRFPIPRNVELFKHRARTIRGVRSSTSTATKSKHQYHHTTGSSSADDSFFIIVDWNRR